jgi:hypothetical protein
MGWALAACIVNARMGGRANFDNQHVVGMQGEGVISVVTWPVKQWKGGGEKGESISTCGGKGKVI